MDETFLRGLLSWIQGLNAAAKLNGPETQASMFVLPFVPFAPVTLDGSLCGFLIEEDGQFSYEESTPAQQEWWTNRPSR